MTEQRHISTASDEVNAADEGQSVETWFRISQQMLLLVSRRLGRGL